MYGAQCSLVINNIKTVYVYKDGFEIKTGDPINFAILNRKSVSFPKCEKNIGYSDKAIGSLINLPSKAIGQDAISYWWSSDGKIETIEINSKINDQLLSAAQGIIDKDAFNLGQYEVDLDI